MLAGSVNPGKVREFYRNQLAYHRTRKNTTINIPESVEAAMTAVFKASNSLTRSEKARISVGQTKLSCYDQILVSCVAPHLKLYYTYVKSIGYQKKTTYLPL